MPEKSSEKFLARKFFLDVVTTVAFVVVVVSFGSEGDVERFVVEGLTTTDDG